MLSLTHSIICCLIIAKASNVQASEIYRGVLTLDDLTFDKIVNRFKYVLVKFDNAFPYGHEHENFVRLAQELWKHKDIVAVNLEIKDYGIKDSLDIANRFGIKKEHYPALLLLHNDRPCELNHTKSSTLPWLPTARFPVEKNKTIDKIVLDPGRMRTFLYQETGIRLTLPNCTVDLDRLADRFIALLADKQDSSQQAKLDKILESIVRMTEKSSESKQRIARIYLALMRKALERDNVRLFFESELQRVKNVAEGKISDAKRDELRVRSNVIHSFVWALDQQQRKPGKDEL